MTSGNAHLQGTNFWLTNTTRSPAQARRFATNIPSAVIFTSANAIPLRGSTAAAAVPPLSSLHLASEEAATSAGPAKRLRQEWVPDLAAPSTLVPNGTCSISTGGNGTDYDYRVQAGKNLVHPGAGAHS